MCLSMLCPVATTGVQITTRFSLMAIFGVLRKVLVHSPDFVSELTNLMFSLDMFPSLSVIPDNFVRDEINILHNYNCIYSLVCFSTFFLIVPKGFCKGFICTEHNDTTSTRVTKVSNKGVPEFMDVC